MMRHSLPFAPTSMSWYLYQIDRFLKSLDFRKNVVDTDLYSVGDNNLILMTYSESLVVEIKQALTSDFHKGSKYDTLLLGTRSMIED
jgi:hypothetical protein